MKELLPVEGSKTLFRDKSSRGIVNVAPTALAEAKFIKQKISNETKKVESLENRINTLESKLDKLINHLIKE